MPHVHGFSRDGTKFAPRVAGVDLILDVLVRPAGLGRRGAYRSHLSLLNGPRQAHPEAAVRYIFVRGAQREVHRSNQPGRRSPPSHRQCGPPGVALVDTISSLGCIDYRHDEWGGHVAVAELQAWRQHGLRSASRVFVRATRDVAVRRRLVRPTLADGTACSTAQHGYADNPFQSRGSRAKSTDWTHPQQEITERD